MPPTGSCQEVYAANLSNPLGVAVFNPIPFRTETGRVGDIGFFHHNGEYEWIRNAFDSEVNPSVADVLILRVYRIKNGNGHYIITMRRQSSSKRPLTFGSHSDEMLAGRILTLGPVLKYRSFKGTLGGIE